MLSTCLPARPARVLQTARVVSDRYARVNQVAASTPG